MVLVPVLTAVTKPVLGFTVATAVLLLLHTPPAVTLLKVVVAPTVKLVVPVIAAGVEGALVTVNTRVAMLSQPIALPFTNVLVYVPAALYDTPFHVYGKVFEHTLTLVLDVVGTHAALTTIVWVRDALPQPLVTV
jgi:hypothetical protein